MYLDWNVGKAFHADGKAWMRVEQATSSYPDDGAGDSWEIIAEVPQGYFHRLVHEGQLQFWIQTAVGYSFIIISVAILELLSHDKTAKCCRSPAAKAQVATFSYFLNFLIVVVIFLTLLIDFTTLSSSSEKQVDYFNAGATTTEMSRCDRMNK